MNSVHQNSQGLGTPFQEGNYVRLSYEDPLKSSGFVGCCFDGFGTVMAMAISYNLLFLWYKQKLSINGVSSVLITDKGPQLKSFLTVV